MRRGETKGKNALEVAELYSNFVDSWAHPINSSISNCTAPPQYVLKCLKGVMSDRFYYVSQIEKGNIIGSDAESTDVSIYMFDPSISGHHACIQYLSDTQKYVLKDLSSMHGTWIKLRPHCGKRLYQNQEIHLNDLKLRVSFGEALSYMEAFIAFLDVFDLEHLKDDLMTAFDLDVSKGNLIEQLVAKFKKGISLLRLKYVELVNLNSAMSNVSYYLPSCVNSRPLVLTDIATGKAFAKVMWNGLCLVSPDYKRYYTKPPSMHPRKRETTYSTNCLTRRSASLPSLDIITHYHYSINRDVDSDPKQGNLSQTQELPPPSTEMVHSMDPTGRDSKIKKDPRYSSNLPKSNCFQGSSVEDGVHNGTAKPMDANDRSLSVVSIEEHSVYRSSCNSNVVLQKAVSVGAFTETLLYKNSDDFEQHIIFEDTSNLLDSRMDKAGALMIESVQSKTESRRGGAAAVSNRLRSADDSLMLPLKTATLCTDLKRANTTALEADWPSQTMPMKFYVAPEMAEEDAKNHPNKQLSKEPLFADDYALPKSAVGTLTNSNAYSPLSEALYESNYALDSCPKEDEEQVDPVSTVQFNWVRYHRKKEAILTLPKNCKESLVLNYVNGWYEVCLIDDSMVNSYDYWLRMTPNVTYPVNPDDALRFGDVEFIIQLYNTGVSKHQGRRPTMEDEEVVIQDLAIFPDFPCSFFGVYDGHGGSECAAYLKYTLHRSFRHHILEQCGSLSKDVKYMSHDHIFQALRNAFLSVDREFLDLFDGLDNTGCAAVVVAILGDKIWCANCGDARAVLCRDGTAVQLSLDHKPNRPDEMERVIRAGGFVKASRVLGRLAVSRAFGDREFKEKSGSTSHSVVVATPEIRTTQLTDNVEFLLIACDGLFDVFTSQEAVNFVRSRLVSTDSAHHDPQKIANNLVEEALVSRNSKDNVSVILVLFQHKN